MSRRLYQEAGALLNDERGAVIKDPGGRLRVCLVSPSEYPLAMSSLGFLGVYGMLNAMPGVFCERAFMPSPGALAEHTRTRTPLFSLETRTPLSGFDIVAFSVAFENDYPNIPALLKLGGIAPLASERILLSEKKGAMPPPLVIMGGVCAFSNPEPLADFMDVVFVGEAEGMLEEFISMHQKCPGGRQELLRLVSSMEGVYLPSLYDIYYDSEGRICSRVARVPWAPSIIRRRHASDISAKPLCATIVTPRAEFSSMRLVEAMRGCPWTCNFCLAGHVYGPPRIKSAVALKAELMSGLEGGPRKAGLIAPSLSDYPHRDEVLGMEGVEFSITSLRATPKSAELAALLRGHRSLTIAPEAGSERLRRAINKKVTQQDILSTSRALFEAGLKALKLYFIIGLPGERDSDLKAIAALVSGIRDSAGGASVRLQTTLSIFVPKPSTPFQWEPMLPEAELKRRIAMVRAAMRGLGGLSAGSPREAHMQGLFSRGDRRVSAVLLAMADGASFAQALRASGIEAGFYTLRPRAEDEPLPWDFIEGGSARQILWERRAEALRMACRGVV